MIKNYILIDPFNSITSGVTTYTNSVVRHLNQCGVRNFVIARNQHEKLNDFRLRVAKETSVVPSAGLIVEAPESLYTTSKINSDICLHIRLHGSRQLGNWLQNKDVNKKELAAEQAEINKAKFISSPSMAAINASNHIFKYQDQIAYYPNPVPFSLPSAAEKNIDILFLGRWQHLKGIDFFEHVSQHFSGYHIAIAASVKPNVLPKGVQYLSLDLPKERHEILARSSVIVIPSLFETASMVGLEALSAKCKIVTWAHLGLVEYANKPCIYSASSWSVNDLITSIKEAQQNNDIDQFDHCIKIINHNFSIALNEILLGKFTTTSKMPVSPSKINWNNIFNNRAQLNMKKNKLYIFKRKIMKMMRDPIAFWKDSFIFLFFTKVENINSTDSINFAQNRTEDENLALTQTKNIAANILSANLLHMEIEEPIVVCQKKSEVPPSDLLGILHTNGKITINDPPKKPQGWVTALIHPNENIPAMLGLRAELTAFNDFAPLKNENLKHIISEINSEEAVISILNRLDVNNKGRISQINNLVFINTPENTIQAMRCCGPTHRTILILTDTALDDISLAPAYTDAVICLASHPATAYAWRRINIIESVEQLPSMLRKVLQEIGPKSPNMLLPLIRGTEYNPKLINFDSQRYQGLIRLKSKSVPRVNSLREYTIQFSENIYEMLVLDSIYMQYRSLCEQVENGESPASLIEACLQDGVLFDVN